MIVVAPTESPRYVQAIPPTWNIGNGVSDTDSASNDHTGTLRVAAARLRCVVSTPFGTPVVPDVYICSTGSSASPRPPGSIAGCDASHASYSAPTATTRNDGDRPEATSTKSGPASSTGAPASVTIAVSSGAARRQFKGTATAPIFAQAASSSTTSGALRSRWATRDPAPAPAASRACASRFERSSNDA